MGDEVIGRLQRERVESGSRRGPKRHETRRAPGSMCSAVFGVT